MLKEARVKLGLTQKEVADFVGVSSGTISRWESGDIKNMRRDRIFRLAKILKIKPMDIVNLQEMDGMTEGCGMETKCRKSIMEKLIKLDAEDLSRIDGMVDLFLSADKYKKDGSKKMAM